MKWRYLLRSSFLEIYVFIWNRCFQGSAWGCTAGNYDPKLSGFTCCLANYLLPSTLKLQLVTRQESLFLPPANAHPLHIFSKQQFSPLGQKQPYLADCKLSLSYLLKLFSAFLNYNCICFYICLSIAQHDQQHTYCDFCFVCKENGAIRKEKKNQTKKTKQ